MVPSESNQSDSIRVYTTSEIEPVRIDSNLRPSVNGLLVLEMNSLKARVQTSAPHSYLLTDTHLRKWAVATLSYSPKSTPHPQVIYTIALSAGLNGLQVH